MMNNLPALRCVSSMATRQLLGVLAERWSALTGQPVALESVGGVDAARRIDAGEAFDLAVLAADALDRLAAAGRVGPAGAVAVSGVAIAATAGTAPPVATVAQLLETLQAARGIAYSTGPSGTALLKLLAQWGVAQSLQPRLLQAPPGVPVAELIASGRCDLGFQQLSELVHQPGIALLGPMPPGAEIDTVFAAAPCTAATQPEPAADFIAYLLSANCAEAIRSHGMQPPAGPRAHA